MFSNYTSGRYRVLGKHAAKIQGIIPLPILRIFCPIMIFEKPLCFKYTGRTKFATQTTFYDQKVEVSTSSLIYNKCSK